LKFSWKKKPNLIAKKHPSKYFRGYSREIKILKEKKSKSHDKKKIEILMKKKNLIS